MLEQVTVTTTAVVSEGQYQLEKFGYDPYTKGKAYKTKQVTDFIEQPWYSQLMESGGIQVYAHLCRARSNKLLMVSVQCLVHRQELKRCTNCLVHACPC